MSLTITETAGDTLIGAINSSNKQFTTSFDFIAVSVNVYLNGQLKVPAYDDGFTIIGVRTVEMKLIPIIGDTLVIEYQTNIQTGGGALGGVPPAPNMLELAPVITSIETTIVECLTP